MTSSIRKAAAIRLPDTRQNAARVGKGFPEVRAGTEPVLMPDTTGLNYGRTSSRLEKQKRLRINPKPFYVVRKSNRVA
jgi:hypothetical protein